MKKILRILIVFTLCFGLVSASGVYANNNIEETGYIVEFNDPAHKGLIKDFGVEYKVVLYESTLLLVLYLKLTEAQPKGLAKTLILKLLNLMLKRKPTNKQDFGYLGIFIILNKQNPSKVNIQVEEQR